MSYLVWRRCGFLLSYKDGWGLDRHVQPQDITIYKKASVIFNI